MLTAQHVVGGGIASGLAEVEFVVLHPLDDGLALLLPFHHRGRASTVRDAAIIDMQPGVFHEPLLGVELLPHGQFLLDAADLGSAEGIAAGPLLLCIAFHAQSSFAARLRPFAILARVKSGTRHVHDIVGLRVFVGDENIPRPHLAPGLPEHERPELKPCTAPGSIWILRHPPRSKLGRWQPLRHGPDMHLNVEVGEGTVCRAFCDAVALPQLLGAGAQQFRFLHALPVSTERILPRINPHEAASRHRAMHDAWQPLTAEDVPTGITARQQLGVGLDLLHGHRLVHEPAHRLCVAIAEGVGDELHRHHQPADQLTRKPHLRVSLLGGQQLAPLGHHFVRVFSGGQQSIFYRFQHIDRHALVSP